MIFHSTVYTGKTKKHTVLIDKIKITLDLFHFTVYDV